MRLSTQAVGLLVIACLAAPTAQSRPVFSNFGRHLVYNDVTPSPWCITGSSTPDCGPPVTRWVAVGFTPKASTTLADIYVAIENIDAPNSVVIDLEPDFLGTPANGPPLEEWTLTNLPVNAASFPPEKLVSRLHPALVVGQQYWVVVKPGDPNGTTLNTWYWGARKRGNALDGLQSGLQWLPIKRSQAPALAVYGQ